MVNRYCWLPVAAWCFKSATVHFLHTGSSWSVGRKLERGRPHAAGRASRAHRRGAAAALHRAGTAEGDGGTWFPGPPIVGGPGRRAMQLVIELLGQMHPGRLGVTVAAGLWHVNTFDVFVASKTMLIKFQGAAVMPKR